jgi:adenylate cyclase
MTEQPSLDDIVTQLDAVLLGGPRIYTRSEVEQRSGVPDEISHRLWRALGYPEVAEDEVAFTDGDVEALLLLRGIEEAGIVDTELAVSNARGLARQLGRLADWQVEMFLQRFLYDDSANGVIDPDDAAALLGHIVPLSERLVVYVWRRQLAAAGGRLLAALDGGSDAARLAVGFADISGYTRLARGLDESELSELIDRFESRASDLVADAGGRVVKTIGDEVLFVADDLRCAVDIGLDLLDAYAVDDEPDVHIGIAWGNVLSRLGDVYGTTVNLASRLTSIARPGTLLVDREANAALADEPDLSVRPIPPQRVRGFGAIEAHRVRRKVKT